MATRNQQALKDYLYYEYRVRAGNAGGPSGWVYHTLDKTGPGFALSLTSRAEEILDHLRHAFPHFLVSWPYFITLPVQ